MLNICKKNKCTGCTACYTVCPTKCISMEEDFEGFLYPKIIQENCINCNLCFKTCPTNSISYHVVDSFPDAFLTFSKRQTIRVGSASGGCFTEIATAFLAKCNSLVYGVCIDDNFKVSHVKISDSKHLNILQKSKYVQSYLGDTFAEIEINLEKGMSILFSGTACQIYGLKNCLSKELQSNLFCIDIICRGVPSPKVFENYIRHVDSQYGGIRKFIGRDKELRNDSYRIGNGFELSSGKRIFINYEKDYLYKLFFANVCSRPACHNCNFKTVWKISDLTIGDFWFANQYIPNFKDESGVTLVFAQSKKGFNILNSAKSLEIFEIDSAQAIKLNGGQVYSSVQANPQRESFFRDLNNIGDIGFPNLVKKYQINESNSSLFLSFVKTVLKSIGLFPSYLTTFKMKNEIKKRLAKSINIESIALTKVDNE